MTGWISENDTRHIPEDELHAYLDQALSRSQAAEIECHLAECRRCQVDRDRVAALRDRITALLADAAPRRIHPIPAFEQLVEQHQARVSARQIWIGRVRRYGALAAGLLAAVTAGWWTQASFRSDPAPVEASAEQGRTLIAAGPVQIVAADSAPTSVEGPEGTIALADAAEPSVGIAPVTAGARQLGRLPADRPIEPVIQVTSVAAEDESFVLPGMWQSLDWQVAVAETGGNIPRINGLPILDIQLQWGGDGERPIVVVSQQHSSGRVVKTVEGPMDKVSELLERQAARSPGQLRFSSPEMTPPDYLGDGSVAGARRGLRILSVIGPLPADSLNAMAKGIEIRE